jgi:hypothetical protein
MKKRVGDQLCITGVILLLTSFAWAAFDADLALAVRGLGGALIVSGLGVRGSASVTGRVWVGWLGLLLLVPGLFSLPLLLFLRFGTELRLSLSWQVFWFLGLVALCGAVLMVSATERALGLSERQARLHANVALLLGRAYQAKASPLRVRSDGFFQLALLLAGCLLALRWSGLPPAKLPGLLIAGWFVAEATVVLHEVAHAVWGVILGHEVAGITIGGGPLVIRFALGSVPVELGLLPLHGRVHFRFGDTATWRGMRQVAWAGPVSGILPLLLGTVGLLYFERGELAFWVSACAVLFGVLSLGQLSPERVHLGHRIEYSDGMWLFLNEAVRRQIFLVLELADLRSGLPASAEARALLPRFVDFWQQLKDEPNERQSTRLLAALAAAASDEKSSPLTESAMCQLFALGMLTTRALKDDELSGLEAAVDAYADGSASPLLKTRALDLSARALLFPLRAEAVPLAERWARRAIALRPEDPALYGTLGVALVERGEKAEAHGHLRHLLQHSRVSAERRLARRYLER